MEAILPVHRLLNNDFGRGPNVQLLFQLLVLSLNAFLDRHKCITYPANLLHKSIRHMLQLGNDLILSLGVRTLPKRLEDIYLRLTHLIW